jgi:hypothetical protein
VPCTEVRSLGSKSRESTHSLRSIAGTNVVEALEMLRQRYNAQHYGLRKFYYECSNLKYLTGLINVPKLGQVCHTSSKLDFSRG